MDTKPFEIGAWLGRSQAFRLIATQCSAADAQCLKAIKDSEGYKELNLTWDEFCSRHAGVHRTTADRIIAQLEEFGAAYFQLAEVMRISPATYRRLAPAVSEGALEFHGEKIPIDSDNAERVARAVRELTSDGQPPPRPAPRQWIESLLQRLSARLRDPLAPEERVALAETFEAGALKLLELAETLRK